MQLSDGGTITYHGQRLDQSAVELACAELDDPSRLRLWYRLANMPALNEFLATGRSEALATSNTQHLKALKADEQLLALIGPRYAEQYDWALAAAFQARDAAGISRIAGLPFLFALTQQAQATRTVGRLLRGKAAEILRQAEALDEDDNAAQAVQQLRTQLNQAGWTAALNALPALLAGPRNEVVLAVRNYCIAFYNTLAEPASALQLLHEAATVPTDAQTLDRVREDIRQIQEIEQKQVARKQRNAWIEEYNTFYNQLAEYKRLIAYGFKDANLHSLRRWIPELTTYITKLNALSGDETAKARNDLAWAIRGLTVDIWNKNQALGNTAVLLADAGLKIQASKEVGEKLKEDKAALKRLIRKRIVRQVPDRVWSWGAIALILFVVVMCSKLTDKPYQPTASIDSDKYARTTLGAPAAQNYRDSVNQAATYEPEVSKYAGNQLRNGASPLDNCFGKGKYAGPCWVEFKNDNNDTDAIVCLARANTGKVIRNEYVQAGTSFRMGRIPAGTYYLKVFYGRDWNPSRRSACGTKGYFDSDQHFSESRSYSDLLQISSNSRRYTTGFITLYTVAGGNMAQANISADDFFRQ